MRSKGQIDMFGLVIIVFLLVVIAVFSLFFISFGSEERDVYYSLKANNFANSLGKASIGASNFESLVLSCCSSSSCDVLLGFVEEKFDLLDDVASAKFELDCYFGGSFSRGECSDGIASESLILQSGDAVRVFLCRK
jgi:hypothetical protein